MLAAIVTILTFIYGNKASVTKEKIANQKIAEANATAAVANEQAAVANLKSQSASATAELAKAESASATLAAMEAKNKQTELTIALNESNTKRIESELALKKQVESVAERQKPRSLTNQQMTDLVIALKTGIHLKKKIYLITVIANGESQNYGREIENAFTKAGWEVIKAGVLPSDYTPYGLAVISNHREDQTANFLLSNLRRIIPDIYGQTGSLEEPQSVTIRVGLKANVNPNTTPVGNR